MYSGFDIITIFKGEDGSRNQHSRGQSIFVDAHFDALNPKPYIQKHTSWVPQASPVAFLDRQSFPRPRKWLTQRSVPGEQLFFVVPAQLL